MDYPTRVKYLSILVMELMFVAGVIQPLME
jgi:hypothetical protein